MKKHYLICLLMFLFVSYNLKSQILTFEFSALSGSETTATSSTNDSNISSSTISRGSGLTASGNGGRFNATNWNTGTVTDAISGNDYMEFTITPNIGFEFSITSIDVNIQRSSSGPGAVSLRSSADGYSSDLDTEKSISDNTSTQTFTFTFSQTSSSAITYRFYLHSAESTGGSGGFEGTGDDITVNGSTASAGQTVGFDSSSSTENETDATFGVNIPVTLANYGGSQVDLSVTVDGSSTAEGGDYTLNTSSLSFTSSTTQNISLSINDDADTDDETVILNIAETTATGITISTSQHTVTITDDETPILVISEIMYNTPSTDDEWIEIYNGTGTDIDVSNYTVEYNSSIVFTFPSSTTITNGDYITIALGSNGDGSYNNDNTFTPDYSSVADPIADTSDTNNLGNSSGTITLKNSGGTTLDEVAYDDGDASSTDGSGPSYEIIDLTLDNSATSSNWQASAFDGGSPGKVSTTTWSGGTDNDWDTSANWSAGVPISTSDILIPGSLTNYPSASGAVTINSATINSGASLIAQSTFSGNITYNRSLGTTNWYLVGAPVAGETIEDMITNNSFASGTGSNIGWAPYDNTQATSTDRWDYQTAASTGSLTSGDGYSVKLSTSGTLAFTGTMETSDVGVSITSGAGNAFNLVGNPYPSYMAANSNADGTNNLLSVNTSDLTENTLWFWNQGTNSYDQINQASAAFYVAPAQGFFVESTGSNTFNFTEAMQSHQGTDSFQRTSSNPFINLTLDNGDKLVRDADIYYIDGASTGFDNGYDSTIFGGVNHPFAIYTEAVANGNGKNLGIQSLPNSDHENMVIPVGVIADTGTITFSAESFNLPNDYKVYLEDKETGDFIRLDDGTKHDVVLNNTLNDVGRFYLHTRSGVLSDGNDIQLDNVSIYTTQGSLRIQGVHQGTAKVTMFNILGKQSLSTSFKATGTNDITLPKLSRGVYIVRLETETGTLNKKVIIQ